ncbi:MAG: 6-phosphogluconolactonase [Nitrosomonas sp.]|nr:MAG: 6-phosphogluconolactonase [Nitrosomonas sp.]
MIQSFDDRRDIIIPGDKKATLDFCIHHFITQANNAIADHGYFTVALSGGSTPAAIYQGLGSTPMRHTIDWSKVFLFWSDERSVSTTDANSNYRMAMESGLTELNIPTANIFRMQAEENIVANALAYEKAIKEKASDGVFDFVMLGMGDDGHTASLFPYTHALHARNRLAVANWVPQHSTWRMTLTYDCINAAKVVAIYVLGKNKAEKVNHVLNTPLSPDSFPVQKIGTSNRKALWILDQEAAANLLI